jgi:signal transduction histidine kinase
MTSQYTQDESVRLTEGSISNSSRINIELGSATIAIVVSLMIIIAACGTVMGLNLAKQSQMDRDFKDMKTQDWLKERRLMDREAYDILNGKKLSGDDEYGPAGNVQRMVPKH